MTFIRALTPIALCVLLSAAAVPLVRVVDGNTIRLGAERIRILGIDTPELGAARCTAERRAAEVAKRRLTEIISGQELEIVRNGKDRYGRTLAWIRVRGADVGEMLI